MNWLQTPGRSAETAANRWNKCLGGKQGGSVRINAALLGGTPTRIR